MPIYFLSSSLCLVDKVAYYRFQYVSSIDQKLTLG